MRATLAGLLYDDGHVHFHLPDKQDLEVLIQALGKARGDSPGLKPGPEKRKVILYQKQSPGDILTMSRAVADLKQSYPAWDIDVRSPAMEIWEGNTFLTPLKEDDPEVEKFTVSYPAIHNSGWRGLHFSDAFREDMEEKLGVKIQKTGIVPHLELREEEKGWINQVEVEFGWKGPFWLLNAGRKQDNELKQYHRWQEVVNHLNQLFEDRVKIVQIGHRDHVHPKLDGVYSLVGKTDTRQLIRLAWWSHGTVGPLSFQFVIAAAFAKPHVVVAGGKEGVRWHIYPNGRYIHTNGSMKCCQWDGCWLGGEKGKCKDLIGVNGTTVPRCFDLIKSSQIAEAVWMYYEGGMLNINERGR